MKSRTNTRVRRNGSAGAAAQQVKTQTRLSPADASPAGDVTLVVKYPDGREFARFDLPRDIFAQIETVCRERGMTVPEFAERAVRDKIKRETAKGGAR